MAVATAPAPVAADDTRRDGSAMIVAVACAVVIGTMFMAAVAGNYISVRSRAGGAVWWQGTAKMKFNNYGAVTGFLSAAFASVAMEYAVVSTRAGIKKWSSAAHGLAVLTMLAAINLAWSIGRTLGFGVNDTSYATAVYTVIAAAVIVMAVSLVGIITSWTRVLSGQASDTNWLPVRCGAWMAHLGMAAWATAWATIFLYK
jgi:hypothetical protein